MRTKKRTALCVAQHLSRERTEAYHDARALALELARGVPSARFDPMAAGVVLQAGETLYRQLPMWIRVQNEGRWADVSCANVFVTDKRLLCRFSTGRLAPLWWNGVVGLSVDLVAEHIVLDFGDGQPVGLAGLSVGSVAVAAVASVYGLEAMLTHPALASLRKGVAGSPVLDTSCSRQGGLNSESR